MRQTWLIALIWHLHVMNNKPLVTCIKSFAALRVQLWSRISSAGYMPIRYVWLTTVLRDAGSTFSNPSVPFLGFAITIVRHVCRSTPCISERSSVFMFIRCIFSVLRRFSSLAFSPERYAASNPSAIIRAWLVACLRKRSQCYHNMMRGARTPVLPVAKFAKVKSAVLYG